MNYKEAITKTVENWREVYKKQSGGRGKFADIIVTVGPKDPDYKEDDLQFINEVKGGNIPRCSRSLQERLPESRSCAHGADHEGRGCYT